MNFLTDDEMPKLVARDCEPMTPGQLSAVWKYARSVEAAVLAKLVSVDPTTSEILDAMDMELIRDGKSPLNPKNEAVFRRLHSTHELLAAQAAGGES
jgi:hypothetical protein